MAPRPFQRILVANRGEVAVRILQACRELPAPAPITYALYTADDTTHISLGRPDHAIRLPSPAAYMDIGHLLALVKEHHIDAVHPGYGFLSESPEFSRRVWEQSNGAAVVIGPGWQVLEQTGDKIRAKALAQSMGVPVLKAMATPTRAVADVRNWVVGEGGGSTAYPVMVKAVDGGGGRGIRLVRAPGELQAAVERCLGESASGMVFAEQAAVDGYKHIEVQILGDGKGGAKHLWERDCSVQRRFQKIVEVAPAPVARRQVIVQAIEAAVRMARGLKYLGLGTWEFLVNIKERKFFFLEINPRLQVEHTITEGISGVDLVREQLLIQQEMPNPEDIRLAEWWEADKLPMASSIQLRLCAEDPKEGFGLSIGKVTEVQLPSGNGVRVDSHLSKGGVVGTDFDNLMAKIIVTASTWPDVVAKAQRTLADTKIVGIKTNLNLLRAIVADRQFQSGVADTKWLENNLEKLVTAGEKLGKAVEAASSSLPKLPMSFSQQSSLSSSSIALRKGDAWSLTLEEAGAGSTTPGAAHHLSIDRISRNEFPDALAADVSYTTPGAQPKRFKMTMASTKSSADATSSTHRRGDAGNKSHILVPMSGKLIEVLVEEGDEVQQNDVIAFVKQMKMELEIRSPQAGKIAWALELENEDGDDVAEGVLLAELQHEPPTSKPEPKSKL